MDKLYVIKIGKMYVETIYINKDDISTDFISELDFTSDKSNIYLKLNEDDANCLVDKLYKVFNIYIEDLIVIEEVEDEERK